MKNTFIAFILTAGLLLSANQPMQSRRLRASDIQLIIELSRHVNRSRKKKHRRRNKRETNQQSQSISYTARPEYSNIRVRDIEFLIRYYSRKHKLDPRLVKAVIKVESNFNPQCLSEKGAMGLMQIMPDTARGLGLRNPWSPIENIEGGVRYLASQFERFGSIKLALAAYNAGPGNVTKYNGVPPFAETRRYLKKVLAVYQEYCVAETTKS